MSVSTPDSRESAEQHFAARMKALRTLAGLSQVKLAESLPFDDMAVLRIEKNADGEPGARRIRLDEAVAIADVLGASLASMLPASTRTEAGQADLTLVKAAAAAPCALGDFLGHAVAVVLLDHSEDEVADPNIHELAHRVLMLARLGG